MTGSDWQIALKGMFVVGVGGALGHKFMSAAIADPTPAAVTLNAAGLFGSACIGYLGALTISAAFKN